MPPFVRYVRVYGPRALATMAALAGFGFFCWVLWSDDGPWLAHAVVMPFAVLALVKALDVASEL